MTSPKKAKKAVAPTEESPAPAQEKSSTKRLRKQQEEDFGGEVEQEMALEPPKSTSKKSAQLESPAPAQDKSSTKKKRKQRAEETGGEVEHEMVLEPPKSTSKKSRPKPAAKEENSQTPARVATVRLAKRELPPKEDLPPLLLNAEQGDLVGLREAIDEVGSDGIDAVTSIGSRSALHLAAAAGHADAVEALVAAGASINLKSAAQTTPLHLAVLNGHMPCVQKLLAAGADMHSRNGLGHSNGATPLEVGQRLGLQKPLLQALTEASKEQSAPTSDQGKMARAPPDGLSQSWAQLLSLTSV
mmetsp:Transcript_35855/g.65784  ORF Transcript_35855/g.65784 Transcript_35855/m.65784 type:complete len:301 (-) Transcript_35855:20-922(-)